MATVNCRVLKKGKCIVTQKYKGTTHGGIDLVGEGYTLDDVVAHSAGEVVSVVSNINYNTYKSGQKIYGNYIKIKHDNGMYTIYAHLKYGSIKVKNGQRVSKDTIIAYMGNTGYSTGAHLHFEVRDVNNASIDPTNYLSSDLPSANTTKYTVGKTYTLQVNLKVREGAGTDKKQKKYSQLTADGKEHAVPGENAALKAGTRVTALQVINVGNDVWLKIPSGYVAAVYQGNIYIK